MFSGASFFQSRMMNRPFSVHAWFSRRSVGTWYASSCRFSYPCLEFLLTLLITYCGETMVIVSPRIKTVPSFRATSPSTRSSALSSTMLMWMSNATSVPMYCRWFLSSTSTRLCLALLSASNGLAASMWLSPMILEILIAFIKFVPWLGSYE